MGLEDNNFEDVEDKTVPFYGYDIGAVLNNRYELLEFVGSGSWGNVFRAKDLKDPFHNDPIAIKVLKPTAEALEAMKHRNWKPNTTMHNEKMFKPCAHLVPRYFDNDEETDMPFIVMPYYDTFLDKKLKEDDLSEKDKKYIYTDILRGLAELHSIVKKVHLDIKPDNIALSRDVVYHEYTNDEKKYQALINDFGSSTIYEGFDINSPHNNRGFHSTRAPEVNKEGYKPLFQSDCYSWAALTYKILSGEYPLEEFSNSEINSLLKNEKEYNKIMHKKVNDLDELSDLRCVLRTNLKFNPEDRVSDAQWLHKQLAYQSKYKFLKDNFPENLY